MFTNTPVNNKKPLLTQGSSLAPRQRAAIPLARQRRERQEHQVLKIFLMLLIAISAYSVGSFVVAPRLLPAAFSSPEKPVTKPIATEQAATPVILDEGGVCSAESEEMSYLPASQKDGEQTQQLPSIWSESDYDEHDFASAQACAASFVIAYLSFDFSKTETFEASTSVLSTGALQHFAGDLRLDPFWRESVQKQQLRQSTQVGLPSLLNIQSVDSRMLIWLLVHYQVNVYRGEDVFKRAGDITVLVVSSVNDRKAWQISDWEEGKKVFEPSDPL